MSGLCVACARGASVPHRYRGVASAQWPCAGSARPWPRLAASPANTTVRRAGPASAAPRCDRAQQLPRTIYVTANKHYRIHTITHLIDSTRRQIIRCVTTPAAVSHSRDNVGALTSMLRRLVAVATGHVLRSIKPPQPSRGKVAT